MSDRIIDEQFAWPLLLELRQRPELAWQTTLAPAVNGTAVQLQPCSTPDALLVATDGGWRLAPSAERKFSLSADVTQLFELYLPLLDAVGRDQHHQTFIIGHLGQSLDGFICRPWPLEKMLLQAFMP